MITDSPTAVRSRLFGLHEKKPSQIFLAAALELFWLTRASSGVVSLSLSAVSQSCISHQSRAGL